MKDSDQYIAVLDTSDIEMGHSVSVNLDGKNVLICNTEEGFFAVEDMCTHALIPLCGGLIQGTLILSLIHI